MPSFMAPSHCPSAILVEHALIKLAALREGIYSNNPSLPLRVLDLGTGSGALLLSLLHRAQVVVPNAPSRVVYLII